MRRFLFLFTVFALLLLLLFAVRNCSRLVPERARVSPAVVSPVPKASVAETSNSGSGSSTGDSSADPARVPSFQMKLLDFAIDSGGIRFTRATAAAGRVKAPPLSISPWRIEFTVYGRGGEKLYSGSLDHPLHPRYEYADATPPGQLHTVIGIESAADFQLRLPAELPAARIAFFERRPHLPSDAPPIPLGEISLP